MREHRDPCRSMHRCLSTSKASPNCKRRINRRSLSLWSARSDQRQDLCVSGVHDKVHRLGSLRGLNSKSKIYERAASILLVVHLWSRNPHRTRQYKLDETVGVSVGNASVQAATVEIKCLHLVLMEIVQSILCLGLCPPRDDIRPARIIIVSW